MKRGANYSEHKARLVRSSLLNIHIRTKYVPGKAASQFGLGLFEVLTCAGISPRISPNLTLN